MLLFVLVFLTVYGGLNSYIYFTIVSGLGHPSWVLAAVLVFLGIVTIRQDVRILNAVQDSAHKLEIPGTENRKGWLQVVASEVLVGGSTLKRGDGLALENEPIQEIGTTSLTELLYFDLPQ